MIDGPMGIAEDDPGAHRDELVDEEQAALEHLLEDEHGARGLRRRDDGDRGEVGREGGPDAALDLRDLPAEIVDDAEHLAGRHAQGRLPHLELDPELPERRHDRDQVVRLDVLDREVAPRDGGERGEARDLDVLGADAIRAAAEPVDAFDAEDVRADALDPRAEGVEEAAEVLDVRLAGRMADDRVALGEDGGHDRVLGAHHRGLVEVHPLADEAVRAQVVGAVDLHLDAELGEGVDVGVEPPAPDHVAARRRHDGAAEARQERAGEQERRANLAAEVGVELGLRDPGAVDAHLVRPGPHCIGAEVGEQLDHHLDVADARQVRQPHLLGGEHGRGEDRQGAVLVPGRTDRAGERATTLDDERLHEAGAIVPVALDVTRDNAWTTLTRYTKSESLLRHALAVEASTRWYARHFGEDEELWGCTALLHDFDYEIHPTLDKHPQDGAPILREEGYPEVLILAVLSHAEHLAIPRETLLQKTLFACDELSGFIHACGLVRPTGLEGLEPKSVKKKLKQPSFAAGVHRDEVYAGAELLGLELDEHIANVVAALQPIAGELGLQTAAA